MLSIKVEGKCPALDCVVCDTFLFSHIYIFYVNLKQDLNQLRDLSLGITDNATYRLQIQSSASQIFCSFLPVDMELRLTSPQSVNDNRPMDADVKESTGVDEDISDEPEQKRMKIIE